jgi:hypothetical protein
VNFRVRQPDTAYAAIVRPIIGGASREQLCFPRASRSPPVWYDLGGFLAWNHRRPPRQAAAPTGLAWSVEALYRLRHTVATRLLDTGRIIGWARASLIQLALPGWNGVFERPMRDSAMRVNML